MPRGIPKAKAEKMRREALGRVGRAKEAVQKAKAIARRLWQDYDWDGGLRRPATAAELATHIENMGRSLDPLHDRSEDHERRLRAIEAKLFPKGSPVEGISTEAAFAKSLANTIADKKPDAPDTEGRDII